MKISVVIPVYNAEHVLKRCFEHLVNQTYKNLEFIVVNDGSTDNSEKIIREYACKDNRFVIINQKNAGPADARNNGLKHASGDYIHFCDSDDFVDTDYYEKMIVAINQSNADVVCGEVIERGFLFPKFQNVELLIDLFDKVSVTRAYDFSVVWRFLYKRSFLNKNKINFPSGMFWGEDTRFMLMALYYSNMVATAPGAIYHCIDNPTSLGKNIKSVIASRGNGTEKQDSDYTKFIHDSGLDTILRQARLQPKVLNVHVSELLSLPIFKKKIYSNGDVRYYVFGLPVLLKHYTSSKIRYYLCGLYLFRVYDSIR